MIIPFIILLIDLLDPLQNWKLDGRIYIRFETFKIGLFEFLWVVPEIADDLVK